MRRHVQNGENDHIDNLYHSSQPLSSHLDCITDLPRDGDGEQIVDYPRRELLPVDACEWRQHTIEIDHTSSPAPALLAGADGRRPRGFPAAP